MPDDSIALDDADWEVIADDWWHTPLSLVPCPLSWIDREPLRSRLPLRPEIAARNSHYWHECLLHVVKNVRGAKVCCRSCQEWRYMGDGGSLRCNATGEFGVEGDQELNLGLVGAKMVLDMVDKLERAVGITTPGRHAADVGDIAVLARRVSLLLGDAVPIENPEGLWNEYTTSILDGHRIAPCDAVIFRPDLSADPPPADTITSILDVELDPPRKKSPRFSREVIDLTDSEQSVASEALPATPKPPPIFAANSEDDGRATGTLMAPRLNFPKSDSLTGTAPKFHLPRIPSSPVISYSSGSPPTSDELLTESSHTRCSSLPPGGDLHKEDYDLELVSESTTSDDAEIPHFLVTSSDRLIKQHSRTREIVDRLRSATVPRGRTRVSSTHGSSNPSTPVKNRQTGLNNTAVKQLFQKGSDGWIRLADDAEYPASKAKKDPSGHVSDSPRNPTEDSEPSSDNEEVISIAPAPRPTRDSKRKPAAQSKHARRASERPPAATTAPASAVVVPVPPRRGHAGQRPAQSVQLAPPAAVGTFTFPPPAFYPYPGPLPQYAPAPVMPFGQPPFGAYPPRAGYPAPLPFAGALPHQQQQQQHIPYQHLYLHQQPHRAAYANAPVITGSTGIRHAQW